MYFAKKDFEKAVTRILGKDFADAGFKRYKSRNFVRVTPDNLLQILNFQKSAGFSYFINVNSFPLSQDKIVFNSEGGLRLSNLGYKLRHQHLYKKFDFGSQYLCEAGLYEIQQYFHSHILPWFNMTGHPDTFLEFEEKTEVRSTDQLQIRPLFKGFRTQEFNFGQLLLLNNQLDQATEWYENLRQLLENNEKPYLELGQQEIADFLPLLHAKDSEGIRQKMQENAQRNAEELGFSKLKPVTPPRVTYEDFWNIPAPPEYIPFPGKPLVEYLYFILDGDDAMFQKIAADLKDSYNVESMSKNRIAVTTQEGLVFHMALNDTPYVTEDLIEITEKMTKSGFDLDPLKGHSTRIECWRGFTNERQINSKPIREALMNRLHENFSQFIFIPGRWRFYPA